MKYTMISLIALASLSFIISPYVAEQTKDIRVNIMNRLMEVSSPKLFQAYHMLFKKSYELDSPEGVKRNQIFDSTVQFIKETNAKNLSYTLGINQFTDLSKEEFRKQYLTLKEETVSKFLQETYTEPFDAPYVGASNIDWSKLFRQAVNQGGCGSCWAFSTAGTIEANYQKMLIEANKEANYVGFSPQNLVDCDNNNNGCNGGWMSTALEHVKVNGIAFETAYPYKGTKQTECNPLKVKQQFVVESYSQCQNCTTEQTLGLLAKGPLAIAIDGEGNGVFQSYAGGIIDMTCADINHAVIMVGINRDDNGQGYYIGRNSWGTNWGENGYYRLKLNGAGAGSCYMDYVNIWVKTREGDVPPPPPAPRNPKIWSLPNFEGTSTEVKGNIAVLDSNVTAASMSWEMGDIFKKASLFTGTKCTGTYYTLNSDFSDFTGTALANNVKSIIIGNNPIPTNGCVWLYEESCFSGEMVEVCSSISNLSTLITNGKNWANRVGSVAIGTGVTSYKLVAGYYCTTRNTSTFGLSVTFYKKVTSITITKP